MRKVVFVLLAAVLLSSGPAEAYFRCREWTITDADGNTKVCRECCSEYGCSVICF